MNSTFPLLKNCMFLSAKNYQANSSKNLISVKKPESNRHVNSKSREQEKQQKKENQEDQENQEKQEDQEDQKTKQENPEEIQLNQEETKKQNKQDTQNKEQETKQEDQEDTQNKQDIDREIEEKIDDKTEEKEVKMGDPIQHFFYSKLFSNFKIFCTASTSTGGKNLTELICKEFVNYVESNLTPENSENTQKVAIVLMNAFAYTQNVTTVYLSKISNKKQPESKNLNNETNIFGDKKIAEKFDFNLHKNVTVKSPISLAGGVLMRLNIGVDNNKQWGIIFVSIGNVHIYKVNKSSLSVKEINLLVNEEKLDVNEEKELNPVSESNSPSSFNNGNVPSSNSTASSTPIDLSLTNSSFIPVHKIFQNKLDGFQIKLNVLQQNEIILILNESAFFNFHPKYRGISPLLLLKKGSTYNQKNLEEKKLDAKEEEKLYRSSLFEEKMGRHVIEEWNNVNSHPKFVRLISNFVANLIKKSIFEDILKKTNPSNTKITSISPQKGNFRNKHFRHINLNSSPVKNVPQEITPNECIKMVASLHNCANGLTNSTRNFVINHNFLPNDYSNFPGFLGHLCIAALLASSYTSEN